MLPTNGQIYVLPASADYIPVVFSWNESGQSQFYRLEVRQLGHDLRTATVSSLTETMLLDGGVYSWRVTPQFGASTPWNSFTIRRNVYQAPMIPTPGTEAPGLVETFAPILEKNWLVLCVAALIVALILWKGTK